MKQMAYRKIIRINPYSRSSIISAIKELEEEKKRIENLYEEFLLKLGVKIESHLNALYNGAAKDFNQDYEIDVNAEKDLITVRASGVSVAFIEFGAGIHAGNGQYERSHEDFYPGSWSVEHADTYWLWQHSTPSVEYRWNQEAVHGFDDVINYMDRWIRETADEVFR